VRLGAGGRGAGHAGLAARQLLVGLYPQLAGPVVECHLLDAGGETLSVPDLLSDAGEVFVVGATAERERLGALTAMTMKRLKKPLASSVPLMWRSSSSLVT
jgi:hypothetical protein